MATTKQADEALEVLNTAEAFFAGDTGIDERNTALVRQCFDSARFWVNKSLKADAENEESSA